MIGIGILGAGRVVQNRYVDVFSNELKGARVVYVCDPVKEAADKVARLLGAQPLYTEDDLFNRGDVDVILVCTESGKHHAHARQALLAGKHVIVEKPPAMFPQDILDDEALAAEKKLMYAPIFQNRFNPAIRALKAAFDGGRFGKIVLCTVRLRWCRFQPYYEDGWHGTWGMDGGVINQQAIHHLDALGFVCGPIGEVFAMQGNMLNQLEAEDTTVATVRFKDGHLGAIEATTAARPEDFEASISVLGEKGFVVINGIALNKIETWRFVDERPEDQLAAQKYSQEVPTGYGLSHGPLMQMIVDQLKAGKIDPPIRGRETVATVRLVHALYQSVELSRPVKMDAQACSSRLGKKG